MAIRTCDELLEDIQAVVGDNNSDEVIILIENVTDTMKSLEDVDGRIKEIDETWRKKYRERFYNNGDEKKETGETEETEETEEPKTVEDLFE